MIIRWQIGNFGLMSWRALNLSVSLLHQLEPGAELHVTHQGPLLMPPFSFVHYHPQVASLGVLGRYYPPRFGDSHEVWLDNDHIMWALPKGWIQFTRRTNACLVWRSDWDYYGTYKQTIRDLRGHNWHANAGLWGVPPNVTFEFHDTYIRDHRDVGQEEMGWIVSQLAAHPQHEYIYPKAVSVYNPSHPVLGSLTQLNEFGTHGVHLIGLNRGWNSFAEAALTRIEGMKIVEAPRGVVVE